MTKTNDIQTIAERWIETRNEKDFVDLYNRLRPGLINHLSTIINDYDQRQNIVSDVFINAVTKIELYSKEYKFSTWIYRIATNMALRNKSRNGRYEYFGEDSTRKLEYALNNAIGFKDDPFDTDTYEDLHSELYLAVETVIKNLKPLYRDIMIDNKLKMYKYQDIADRYGLPLQTVKNRVRGGTKILIETLYSDYEDLIKRYNSFESN